MGIFRSLYYVIPFKNFKNIVMDDTKLKLRQEVLENLVV